MSVSIEIIGELVYSINNNDEYISSSQIKTDFEWKEYSKPSFKEDSSDALSQYSVEIEEGIIEWQVHTASSMDGIFIRDTNIIKMPENIEIINDISFELKEWDDTDFD